MDHVFKLSQDRDYESYINIIQKLQEQGFDGQVIAAEMQKRTHELFPARQKSWKIIDQAGNINQQLQIQPNQHKILVRTIPNSGTIPLLILTLNFLPKIYTINISSFRLNIITR